MDAVTGAFSYTGRAIAEELLRRGREVRTLTRQHSPGDLLAGRIHEAPLQFADPTALRQALSGIETLYNTYWVRYARGATTFERAVTNTQALLEAAMDAGVRRVVHVSVTNPTLDSPLPYFRGKAQTEARVAASELSYAIVRPTLIFGANDILLNNIAWALRRFPIFPISGSGSYEVQPVAIEDVARICADAGETTDDIIVDAAGPEVVSYRQLVQAVARAVGSSSRIVGSPRRLVVVLANVVGAIHRDVALTTDELAGLEANLLISHQTPLGTSGFRAWVTATSNTLGRSYTSEVARNFRGHQPL
jgi:uncharacterized protein YbjT (DUF2867 family)